MRVGMDVEWGEARVCEEVASVRCGALQGWNRIFCWKGEAVNLEMLKLD